MRSPVAFVSAIFLCRPEKLSTALAPAAVAAASVGAAEVAATETRFAGLRFLHCDVSALELGIVELLYGFGSILPFVISTKPKPLERPVNLSMMMVALCT